MKMKAKGLILTLVAGALAAGTFVIDVIREKNDREEEKEELKKQLLLELRSEGKN